VHCREMVLELRNKAESDGASLFRAWIGAGSLHANDFSPAQLRPGKI